MGETEVSDNLDSLRMEAFEISPLGQSLGFRA